MHLSRLYGANHHPSCRTDDDQQEKVPLTWDAPDHLPSLDLGSEQTAIGTTSPALPVPSTPSPSQPERRSATSKKPIRKRPQRFQEITQI